MARKEFILCDVCGNEIETKPQFIIDRSNVPKVPIQVNVYRIDATDGNLMEGVMDLCAHCVEFGIKAADVRVAA